MPAQALSIRSATTAQRHQQNSSEDRISPYDATSDTTSIAPYDIKSDRVSYFSPTEQTYARLEVVSNYLNEHLFNGRLPPFVVTLPRSHKALGHFVARRFAKRSGTHVTHEIGLNPSWFYSSLPIDILSTLAHEMVHLALEHDGKSPSEGYHNKIFAKMMRAIGLIPSHNGLPGGRDTGRRMSHYIEPGGRFEVVCEKLLEAGFDVAFVDRSVSSTKAAKSDPKILINGRAEAKRLSKTKFCCPSCEASAWGKPTLAIDCRPCGSPMQPVD